MQHAAMRSAGPMAEQDAMAMLSPAARERIEAMAGMADCQVVAQDGTAFPGLHRYKLGEASVVLRNMITDCGNVSSVPLDEPAAEVALLLNCMYSYEQHVCAEQLPTLLRLADKYDCRDLRRALDRVLDEVELTPANFPMWLQLASDTHADAFARRCVEYATAGNLSAILTAHGETWLDKLPASVVRALLLPRLRLLEFTLGCYKGTLEDCYDESRYPHDPARYKPSAPFFFDGPGTSRGGPLERDTLRRIHHQLNIRFHEGVWKESCDTTNEGDLTAQQLLRMLPTHCGPLERDSGK